MPEHILSLSYGKDSLACLFAIEKLGWPLDRIVHSVETVYELDHLAMLVKDAPAVDAEPVRHARWQFEARGKDGITELPVCSWCGATPKYYAPKNSVGMQVPPYCHECGCKMDAEVRYETFNPEPS